MKPPPTPPRHYAVRYQAVKECYPWSHSERVALYIQKVKLKRRARPFSGECEAVRDEVDEEMFSICQEDASLYSRLRQFAGMLKESQGLSQELS